MGTVPYVELHAHSAFSFLDGASAPEEMAERAAELGHTALALTDHDGLCGSLGLRPRRAGGRRPPDHGRGGHAARRRPPHAAGGRRRRLRQPVPPHHPGPRRHPARRRTGARPPALDRAALAAHAEGLVCLTGCARHGLVPRLVAGRRPPRGPRGRRSLARDLGPQDVYVEIQHPRSRGARRLARELAELAQEAGLRCVATGDPHAHDPARAFLQDAFVAIRHRLTLDGSEDERRGNRQAVLRTPAETAALLRRPPRGRRRDPATGRAPRVRPHPRPRLPLPRLRRLPPRRDRPGGPGARLRLPARRALPQRPQAPRGPRAPRPGAGPHRAPRPRRLLPAAPRHPRAGPRGRPARAPGGVGAALAAARAGARVVGGLDRLLPHRPLPRRSGRERPLPGPLPQPRHGVGARHRPRLPPRRARAADRGGDRPLRRRARRPGGGLPHLPHPHGHPRAGRRAGPARGRPGAPGAAVGRLVVGAGGGGGARPAPRRGGQARLPALAGAGRPRARGRGPAAAPVPALRGHGGERAAAGGAGAGGAGRLPRPPDLPVGQGLLRRRGLREDRPPRPGDAVGGRGVHRPDRPLARRERSTCRASASPTPRSTPRSRTPTRSACSRSRAGPRCRACCRRGPRAWRTSRSRSP